MVPARGLKVSRAAGGGVDFEASGLPASSYLVLLVDVQGRVVSRWSRWADGLLRDHWNGRRDDGGRAALGGYVLVVDGGDLRLTAKVALVD